jgi:hypothetical protein
VCDTFGGGNIINSFVFIKDLAVMHQEVKPEITEGDRWLELLLFHPISVVNFLRHRKLRDFASGGEKKCEEGTIGQAVQSRAKFYELIPIGVWHSEPHQR